MSWSSEPGDDPVGTPLPADDFVSALNPDEANKTRLERAATETVNDLRPLGPPPEIFQLGREPTEPVRPSAQGAQGARGTVSPGRAAGPPARKKSYRWMPVLVAVVVGGFIGLGGAMAAERITNRSSQAEGQAEGVVGDTARADQSSGPGTNGAGSPLGPGTGVDDADVLPINSIRFVAGTTELTNDSIASIGSLARELIAEPNTVIEAKVRTSSEATDAANLALSEAQARALLDRFVAAGVADSQIEVSALGRELITIRQPVTNFVELSAGLERSPLRASIETIPTYAIGINPDSGDLRLESIEPLDQLATALLADSEGRSVTLAAYAFTGVDTAANDRLAAQAAAVIEDYLIATYGIDGQRIDLIIAGDAPYSVPAEIGSHVSLGRIS